jgi:hypothetical protein
VYSAAAEMTFGQEKHVNPLIRRFIGSGHATEMVMSEDVDHVRTTRLRVGQLVTIGVVIIGAANNSDP